MPFFNRSTREYLGSDIYDETQQVTDGRDDYEGFQEDLRPKTYREKYRPIFVLTNLFKLIFPYISGGTLLGLVVFLSFDVDAFLEGKTTLTGWIIGVISLLGCVFLVGINETVKTKSLSEAFYNKVKKLKVPVGVSSRAVITTILSIIGSAIGLYMITYQISDNSGEIKTQSENIQNTAAKTWSDDSLRIVQGYEATISQKRETMENFDPKKFRTRRDQLNNEIIALTQERENRLKTAKDERDHATSQAEADMISKLQANDENATGRGYIAFAVIVFLEILNIYCHFFTWQYKAKAVKEGIEFGAIEASSDKTTFEIQMQRLGAFLQTQGYALGPGTINIPGPGQTSPTPGGSGVIGFPKNSPTPDPLKTNDSQDKQGNKILEKILAELNDLKGQIPQGFLNPQTDQLNGQLTSEKTYHKEVVMDQSHPEFTTRIQPDSYRGIDENKYKIFVREARKVYAQSGRYVKSQIASRTGIAKNTITTYLKVAIERKDLKP